jgi:glucose-6-phosphate isomerase
MGIKLDIKGVRLEYDDLRNTLYEEGKLLERDVRTVGEMKEVLLDSSFVEDKNIKKFTYFMFRGAGTNKKKETFNAYNIRHDITVLLDYDLGDEYNKTLGHYHPPSPSGPSYPELYEVLDGKALFIMQKRQGGDRYDVKLMKAFPGDKVLIRPGYGHITVNMGKGPLILANLVDKDFTSEYEPIRRMHGGAVYYTAKKNIIVNQNYKEMSLSLEASEVLPEAIAKGKSIYDSYIKNPAAFEFLSKPELLYPKG